MRITKEMLLKFARETVSLRVRNERDVVAVYIVGSLLDEEPLLGGTTDIDLFFVHNGDPIVDREIIRVTDEVTIDIAHHPQDFYHQPRHLRTDPWLGPTVAKSNLVLHDTQHWFEFTQASARAQFNRPDYVLERARQQADTARQNWMMMQNHTIPEHPVLFYLKTVGKAANAIASLNGPPLTDRRFLLQFPDRAQAVDRPGLTAGLFGLLGSHSTDQETLKTWLPLWDKAFLEVSSFSGVSPQLHHDRHAYYLRAMQSLAESTQPQTLLWPLLHTWATLLTYLPDDSPHHGPWMSVCQTLELDEEHRPEKLDALDAFLDQVEETLEDWGRLNGA